MKTHLDRVTAGFHVEVGQVELTGEWILKAWTENFHAKVPILPEQRMQAYLHPCSLIPNADRFFRDLREGEVADNSEVEEPVRGMQKIEQDLKSARASMVTDERDVCHGCGLTMMAHESGCYCDRCSDDGS
jgi:hypothetical protein